MTEALPEPWLRGTLTEVPPVARAVLHSFAMAGEDIAKWCGDLSAGELMARPLGLAPAAFHLRHIAGSLDRLLTYAEGGALSREQLAALAREMDAPVTDSAGLLAEFAGGLERSAARVLALAGEPLDKPCAVGRKGLPTTLGGLLVHLAEHTQRHVGQAVATARAVKAHS